MNDPSPGEKPCVLLVDDDPTVLRSLVRVLRREFEVITATDADAAVAKVANALHAVITDHDLGAGKPTGRHVLGESRRLAPNVRRVLISGNPQEPSIGDADLWHTMLVKPVARANLIAALRTP